MKEKIVVPKLSSRITAAIVMGVYIFVSSPVALIAQEIQVEKQKEELFFRTSDNDYILDKKEELITCSKGGTIKLGEASITIPEGALREDTRISIVHHTKTEETGESLYNTIPESGGYRFLPAGTKFEKDVEITLPYDPILNTKPQLLEDMYTYFYDTQLEQWIKLERLEVDQKNCVVKSLTNHFTDMINATLTLPESASPVDVNLNSIKNLEAAKPDSHLIKFNQPKASNFGDGSFSFELGIPSGRKGMQPQVSVAYSSGNGNGIMGKGFDVNYGSSITTDTRFHLPYYSSDIAKKDTYMLDGIILDEISRSGNTIQYVPQKITSYQTIKRYNAYLENEYWIVTDKNGTKTYYGENYLSRSGKSGKVFTWNATRIVDVRGNRIDYEYEKDFYEPQIEVESDIKYNEYVYPSKISYTGYKNEKGNYSVEFVYDEEGIKREDVRIDARSGELVRCERLLTSIKTRYKENDPIRIYSFIYGESLGKVRRLNQLTVSNNAGESYSYGFAYEGLETDDEGNVKYFANPEVWNNNSNFELNKSVGYSIGVNTNISGGAGIGTDFIDVRDTAGFSASASSSINHTKQTVIDIDGDGLCEIVCFKGKKLYVYHQTKDRDGFLQEPKFVYIVNQKGFLMNEEKSSSSSTSWNNYAGLGAYEGLVSGGYVYSESKQNGSTWINSGFYDMDGDGLVDIVLSTEKYLHNDTVDSENIAFSERKISNFPTSEKTELSEEDIRSYKRSYAQQRPFQAWKAPYTGTIQIFNVPKLIKVYFRNNEIGPSSVNINKGEYIYFIPDLGEDPSYSELNKVVSNNYSILYTEIKTFADVLTKLQFYPEKKISVYSEELNQIYNVNYSGQSNIVYELKENFESFLDAEKRKILIEKGLFVPPVLTPVQFNLLKNYVISKKGESADNSYYVTFSKGYEYSITDNLYYLSESVDRNYFETYIKGYLTKEIINEIIAGFSKHNILVDINNDTVMYKDTSAGDYTEIRRIENNIYSSGSVHRATNGNTIIELGNIDGKRLSIEKETKSVYLGGIKSSDFSVVILKDDYIELKDSNSKYKIGYTLSEFSGADSLSENEYNQMATACFSEYSNINNSIWDVKSESEIEKDYIVQKLVEAKVTDSILQEQFIECMYESFVVTITNDETSESISRICYRNKENNDKFKAQLILTNAAFTSFRLGNSNYYDDNYHLKEGKSISDSDVVSLCCQLGFMQYKKISVTIEYQKNGSYEVKESAYKYLGLSKNNGIDIVSQAGNITYPENRTCFNGSADFSSTQSSKINPDELIIIRGNNNDGDICIKQNEILAGGKYNWFYGIWTGSASEHPFNEDEITGNTGANKLSEAELKKVKDEYKNEDSIKEAGQEKAKNAPTNKVFSDEGKYTFYLPEKSYSKFVGIESVYKEPVIDDSEENRATVTQIVSAPEITKSGFLCNRLGGKEYFTIEGVPQSLMDSQKVLQKSVSSGKDKINGIQASLAGISSSFPTNSNGTGNMVQSLQDVNGDRIPDVLIASLNEEKTNIFIGHKDKDNNITYSYTPDKVTFAFDTLSESINSSTSMAVSVGLPITSLEYSGKGNLKSLNISNGSSGSTFGGTNRQKSGIIDINGDGIPDYVSCSGVQLGTGEDYVNGFSYKLDKMSSGEISGFSGNFNIGLDASFITMIVHSDQAKTLKNGPTGSVGSSLNVSYNTQKGMLIDINGDGLLDYLEYVEEKEKDCHFAVYYNTGSSLSGETNDNMSMPKWTEVNSEAEYELSTDFLNETDTTVGGNKITVDENTKTELKGLLDKVNYLDYSLTTTGNISGSAGININIPIHLFGAFNLNITSSIGSGMTAGASGSSVDVKMMDLDGDGLPDHVLDIPGTGMFWKRNLMGKVDLLNKIILPQGGTVELTYEESSPTFENPNFKYVMSSVTVKDGCSEKETTGTGYHSVTTEFKYSDGKYDRSKRDFYGYKTVKTIFADGSYQEDTYNNNEYYSKGTVADSCLYSSDQILLRKSVTSLLPSPYPLPEKEESYEYEKSSNNWSLNSSISYVYDEYLNVSDIKQFSGSEIQPYLSAHIVYQNMEAYHIYGLPVSITVKDSKNKVIRKRTGSYNATGELESLCQYWDSSHYSYNSLVYDEYGNIISVTDSRGASLIYEYGDVNTDVDHMFVTKITQKGNNTDSYDSTISYDMKHQTKTSETDCNGNVLTYNYDSWQRITEIRTSYDEGITPAVRYTYGKTETGRWYAITDNKVLFDKDDNSIIQTVLMTDGVGRAKWTAKTGCVNGEDGWNVSGAVEYDEKGRTIKEGMTSFFNGSLESLLIIDTAMTDLNTVYAYDEKDRPVKTVLPDKSIQTAEFYIEDEHLISVSTDPLGNKTLQKTDSRGNITEVEKYSKENKILTKASYEYDAMSQMIKALDSTENAVTVEYDILGRRTALESADSGRQEFLYDENSNLIAETSSVLREKSQQIRYVYDGLNRLIKIDYPETEDTVYVYGSKDDSDINAAGKILSVTDASGTINYVYGQLGEVIQEERTLYVHINGRPEPEKAVMKYRSDYLGRMQSITYPDEEEIIYGYDKGGQVISVKGSHYQKDDFIYVENILYDEYGQRTRIEYGNGTSTDYTYDPARRWLKNIYTVNQYNKVFQNIDYSFDTVGNVSAYTNNCLDSIKGTYSTTQTYKYDDLYQLIGVSGDTIYNPSNSISPEFTSHYTQDFIFDSEGLGNMTKKTSVENVTGKKSGGDNLNYDFDYEYDEDYAHRLVRSGNRYYKYDSNGNIICEQDGSFTDDSNYGRIVVEEAEGVYSTDYGWGLYTDNKPDYSKTRYRRSYVWNEKNLLIGSVDSRYSTSYVYGQDGQRSNKFTASSETLYFNKMWTVHTDRGVSSSGGQSAKNIYLGEVRIVTKLNSYRNPTKQEEAAKQYYYHSDHLGSASMITDNNGKEYERLEYTPYGELWVEHTTGSDVKYLPYKFTGKEMDEETGLYYYGARYLDPKYSRWLSTDPALGEYIPEMGKGNAKDSGNLPGMGGVYNHINFHLYHYAGNNPIRYVDPTGEWVLNIGVFGSAGAGVGGSLSAGFSIGYSKEKGLTFGVYTTESIGAEFSIDTSAGISLSVDVFSSGVESGVSRTMTVGGSADVGVSFGGDLTLDIDSKNFDISVGVSKSCGTGGNTGAGVKFGIGTSATATETHVRYNSTQTKATSLNEIMYKAGNKLKQLEDAVENYVIERTLEMYGY